MKEDKTLISSDISEKRNSLFNILVRFPFPAPVTPIDQKGYPFGSINHHLSSIFWVLKNPDALYLPTFLIPP